jgi:RNA polymerase sigma factor (sigma-70 family)
MELAQQITVDRLKELLREHARIPDEIRILNKRMKEIIRDKDEIESELKATSYSDMPHGSGTSDPTYQIAARRVDKYGKSIDQLDKEIDELEARWNAVKTAVEALEVLEREIVTLKYFEGYGWHRVAQMIHYSEQRCRQINQEALHKLQKLLVI